jgi:hypothetical protein
LGPRTLIYSILTTAMDLWRSSSWRPSSGTASNAAMPLRSTRATSGSRDRSRSVRAAAIWGPGAFGHVHRQHRAAPRHGRRTAGQGSGRDGARGLHHAKQWRLDHVRQTPQLTACDAGDHQLAAITFRACLKSPRRQSSAATGRFRIRHRPLSLSVENR